MGETVFNYCAPECFQRGVAKVEPSDVFSFVCIAYEVLSDDFQFVLKGRVADIVEQSRDGDARPALAGFHPAARSILSTGWLVAAEARPTMSEIVTKLRRVDCAVMEGADSAELRVYLALIEAVEERIS
jgi:hypothetical protein